MEDDYEKTAGFLEPGLPFFDILFVEARGVGWRHLVARSRFPPSVVGRLPRAGDSDGIAENMPLHSQETVRSWPVGW